MLVKKLLLLSLIILSIFLGYSFGYPNFLEKKEKKVQPHKTPIVRIALVADSENENDLLTKALRQAQGMGINFVIGLGDWTNTGTIAELEVAKKIFDQSGLKYFLTPGDHDLWDSRNRGLDALVNYRQVFGEPSRVIHENGVQFVIIDNSDIYKGIAPKDWDLLEKVTKVTKESKESNVVKTSDSSDSADTSVTPKLTFVFAHKTPFHPESAHVMGEDSAEVAGQAKQFMDLMEQRRVDGFFSGDLHFFARFNSPNGSVKITTIGAASSERNFQGPRFGILTVYNDYSWEVEDVEIR